MVEFNCCYKYSAINNFMYLCPEVFINCLFSEPTLHTSLVNRNYWLFCEAKLFSKVQLKALLTHLFANFSTSRVISKTIRCYFWGIIWSILITSVSTICIISGAKLLFLFGHEYSILSRVIIKLFVQQIYCLLCTDICH